MNFNQLTAAAAAAANGNPNSLNMSNFTTAVTSILANSNIDLTQFANLTAGLTGTGPVSNSRQNLQQAHHSHGASVRNSAGAGANSASQQHPNHSTSSSINSSSHLPSSVSNMRDTDLPLHPNLGAILNLPSSLGNLTSSALADLTAGIGAAAAAAAANQPQQQQLAHNNNPRASIQSAHHRSSSSSSSSNHHHHQQNHHQQAHHHHQSSHHHSSLSTTAASATPLTAAHQSTSAGNKSLSAHHNHHQQQQQQQHHNHHHHQSQNTIHHRHSSSSLSSSAHNNNNHLHHHQQQPHNNNHNLNSSINSNNFNSNSGVGSGGSNNNIIVTNNANSNQTIIATNSSVSITPPKNSTCYRIGDCIYFETSPTLPSQIGRIDEICKTAGDNIEVKVVVFFRRRDISSSLMTLADKYQYDESQEEEIKQMSEKEKLLLKQRELFYSRQIETLPATSIKGKCSVQLLNESESLSSYLDKEDHYFYTLVYDPQQKTISADRGEIRVGQRYQAEVQPNAIYTFQPDGDPADPRDLNEMETLVYTPDHDLTDDDINKFLTIAKSVGTFARALDCSSSIKQPSLHLTAASASRDVTLLYAMQLLHQNNYDLGKAVCALVPSTGPVLCRDEIEEWTAGEATLFEEAIEKYGREFGDIRQDFLPWKSIKNIVEYYYMWKTTDRSINQRRMKALEAENKVSVIYITDTENEMKKSSPISNNNNNINNNNSSNNNYNSNSNNNTSNNNSNSNNSNNNINNNTSSTASGPDTNNLEVGKTRSLKRPLESDDSSLNSTLENPNATLKRRQVTEPKLSAHVACHTTPGENLRFISTKRHKILRRGMINRKQLRHLSRRPWERRAKSRA